nr:translation initiation factor IF-2-like [Aegilops tauschii subsp. strangulata]
MRSAQQGIGAGTRGRSTVGTREGTTSTVNDGSRPDTLAGAYQARVPTGPAGNSIPGKLPPSRCSRHAIDIAAPHPSRSSSSPHRRRRSHARDRPARTQMGPGGPRSGPGTRRWPPHATTPPCCQGQHRHRAYRRRPLPGRRAATQPSITAAVTSPGRETNARVQKGPPPPAAPGPAPGHPPAAAGESSRGWRSRKEEGRAAPATSRGGAAGAGTGWGGGRGGRGGPGARAGGRQRREGARAPPVAAVEP